MRKQENARLAELAAEKAHQEAIQAQLDIVSNMMIGVNSSYRFPSVLLYFGTIYNLLTNVLLEIQERQRKLAEDQRNLVQQQSQAKAQMLG